MLHKFYVVVDDPLFKQEVSEELSAETGNDEIPKRAVEVVNPMPGSEYNSIAMLTQEEADLLLSDLRVREVHRDPYEIGVKKVKCGVRSGIYNKSSTAISSTHKNWALVRSTATTNIFGISSSIETEFPFNLDGSGVDFVIMDSGIEPNHPEFAVNADGTGGSRVVDHDWTQYGYISAVPEGGFLGDCDGHGSNCASIAVGNTCGWAAGAAIYSLRSVGSGELSENDITDGRALGLLDDFEVWQSLRAFHNAKPIDPVTGYKRPTIVNCSFGFVFPYENMTSIVYRGNTYSASSPSATYGTLGTSQGNSSNLHGYRYPALDAEIASTIAAGVIVVAAAGNDRHKIDVVGGIDYNNYWTSSLYGTSPIYYHRGSTPAGTAGVVCVGCIAAFATTDANSEHKRNFSCAGPRVNIWAPGDYIMGAYAEGTLGGIVAVSDPRATGYYLNKVSGTSQASPQVVGVLTCLLQARPWMNQQQCNAWITATASTWAVNQSYYGGSGYTDWGSLQGGAALALRQPFILSTPLTITG
jgi:subtilisin family serine protease